MQRIKIIKAYLEGCKLLSSILKSCDIFNQHKDTGYPHDGRADNTAYRHDRRADKRRYPHDREIDIQMLKMSRNGYILS